MELKHGFNENQVEIAKFGREETTLYGKTFPFPDEASQIYDKISVIDISDPLDINFQRTYCSINGIKYEGPSMADDLYNSLKQVLEITN